MADQNDPGPLQVTVAVTAPMPILTVRVWLDPQHTILVRSGATVSIYTVDADFNKTLVISGTTDSNGIVIFLVPARQGYWFHAHAEQVIAGTLVIFDDWIANDVLVDMTVDVDVQFTRPAVFWRDTNVGFSKAPPLVVNDAVNLTFKAANYGAPGVAFCKVTDATGGKAWEKRVSVASGAAISFVVPITVPPPRGNHSLTVQLGHEA